MRGKFLILFLACLLCWTCYFNAPIFTPDNKDAVYFNLVHITNEYDDGGGCQLTGVIITTNHILTCAHGCESPGQIRGIIRYRKTTETVPLTVIKIDVDSDLALLRFEKPFDREPLAIAVKAVWGEPVIYGGFNALKTPVLRFGFATMNNKGIMVHPVWYGDSGSPLVNTDNELLGLIYRMDVAVVRNTLIPSFALPIQTVAVPFYVFTLIGYSTPLEDIHKFLELK